MLNSEFEPQGQIIAKSKVNPNYWWRSDQFLLKDKKREIKSARKVFRDEDWTLTLLTTKESDVTR